MIEANVRHYVEVEGFSAKFREAVVAALDRLEAQREERGSDFTIAEAGGRPAGCVFLSADAASAGRIRLFFLEQAQRGRGEGRRMLAGLLDRAKASGFTHVRVSTYDRHQSACGLYASFGFEIECDQPLQAFGRQMRQLDFKLELANDAL